MNQKGFATILSLCLILVIALLVKGIQESETNHVYETADFQTEMDLQNAAEGALAEAVEKVRIAKEKDIELLEKNPNPYVANSRPNNRVKLVSATKNSKHHGTITVEVWGERINIHPYKVYYGNDDDSTSIADTKNIAEKRFKDKKEIFLPSYFFFSIARAKNQNTDEEIYRRSSGYVLVDGDWTIYFMELPMSTYKFEK